mmetsp:Transcript_16631/g.42108  ORF Transcript_16631/g.42108 Transcript_16631/m.42108 type:complete len:271 (+) Transcript_16631:366-1178(+)
MSVMLRLPRSLLTTPQADTCLTAILALRRHQHVVKRLAVNTLGRGESGAQVLVRFRGKHVRRRAFIGNRNTVGRRVVQERRVLRMTVTDLDAPAQLWLESSGRCKDHQSRAPDNTLASNAVRGHVRVEVIPHQAASHPDRAWRAARRRRRIAELLDGRARARASPLLHSPQRRGGTEPVAFRQQERQVYRVGAAPPRRRVAAALGLATRPWRIVFLRVRLLEEVCHRDLGIRPSILSTVPICCVTILGRAPPPLALVGPPRRPLVALHVC